MKRALGFILFVFAFLLFSACTFNRVHQVDDKLFASLPQNHKSATLNKYAQRKRVASGKIAKVKTDRQELNEVIRAAQRNVDEKENSLKEARSLLRDLKKNDATDHEIHAAKHDVKIAKHHVHLVKSELKSKEMGRKILDKELDVLKEGLKVTACQRELEKIQSVHEYTNWQVPEAQLQVVRFQEQLRKFEVQESKSKYKLAKTQVKQAKEKFRYQKMKKFGSPEKMAYSPKKQTWQKAFTWAR